MAKCVVPTCKEIIVKCGHCKTLYVPESRTYTIFFEKCPICGYTTNYERNRIPLWKYNLIKWFRGGFKNV